MYKVLLLTKILQRLQGCYQLNKHLTTQYFSKRKSNHVWFTDNKELCFPLETLEIRIQIIWYLDSYYYKKTFPSLGTPIIPSRPSTLSWCEDSFRMPQQCKETLLSENYWFVGHCLNIWLFENLFTYIQPKSVGKMFCLYYSRHCYRFIRRPVQDNC